MIRAEDLSRLRRMLTGLILCVVVLALFALSVALVLICLVGVALLIAGLVSWVHPVDVASAWARTLGGIGLIGGSAGIGALGWLAVERLVGPLGRLARLLSRAGDHASEPEVSDGEVSQKESPLRRTRKFVAAIGILLALICLPFAAAIHVNAHAPWLGWGGSSGGA